MATTLSAGDLAVTGFNFDNPDELAFVLLVDIAAGTQIIFTDNGWQTAGTFRANEGSFTWEAPENLAAGTLVVPTVSGVAFSASGDQILAYQGDASSPTFLYGLNSEGAGVWQADATSSNTSTLPAGLVSGETAVALTEVDNAVYTGPTSGTKAELLAAISDSANWGGSNSDRQTFSTEAFTVTDAGDGSSEPPTIAINELRISAPGSDVGQNFVELFGDANAPLDGLSIVAVSGEFEPGQVDFAFDLTSQTTDENGFFLLSNDDDSFDFFGSPSTFLLVQDFTGAQGDDLDADNNGEFDSAVGTVIDAVSLIDGDDNADQSYSDTVIGPDGNFAPAGIARVEDGTGEFQQLAFGDNAADTPGTSNVVDSGNGDDGSDSGDGSDGGDGGSDSGNGSTFGIQESFESEPGTTYTLSDPFDDGGFDYFGRYQVPDNSNAGRDDFQAGWDGSFGIQGQDHDGDGGAATRTIAINDINIAGGENVAVTAALGALASEPSFFNFETDEGDGIEIYAIVDDGTRSVIGAFVPTNNQDGNAGDLQQDTDLDGVGDGPTLNADLQDFEFLLGTTGSNLDLEIELTSTGSFEPLAVDNVRVSEVIDFQESFESEPGTIYTLSDPFDDSGFDYFGRYQVPDNSNGGRDDFQAGWDGNFGIQGQDHDGDGGAATRTIAVNDIDVFGGQDLFTTISIAALASESSFFNFETDEGDGIEIYATLDDGTRNLIGAFVPTKNSEDGNAGDLQQDTDLDGEGDGTVLTSDLQDFSFAIPGTGSLLDLEIEATSTGSFENWALDNVRIQSGGIPEGSAEPAVEVAIYDIQGAGHTSAFAGQTVLTTGIVTAVAGNGFYLQDATGDSEDATSDAIFVFTGSTPGVSIGDELAVEGLVAEFFPGGSSTGNLSITQITNPVVEVLSSENALPDAVILGAAGRVPPTDSIDDDAFTAFEPSTDGIDFFESLEGMLVTVDDPLAVSATDDNGEIFTVVDKGVGVDSLSSRKTLNIGPGDFNPEKVQINVNSSLLPSFETPIVNAGAELSDVTGVVSYSFGNFEVLPTAEFSVVQVSANTPEITTLEASDTQLTVASYNVLNLDPNDGDGNTDVANGQFEAIAEQIVTHLKTPDIIGLQEIQDNSGSADTGEVSADMTLQMLVNAIVAAGGPEYEFIDNTFIGDQTNGGDPAGNIRTAYLYNPDRVELVDGSVQSIQSADQQTNPDNPFFGGRLPLAATFEFNGEAVTVVNNHFSSKGGSAPIFGVEQPFEDLQEAFDADGTPTVNGSLDERLAQSRGVQTFVNGILDTNPDANVVVLGDLNEFEFVSPVSELETNAGLNNLTNTLSGDERYSFIFQGNSQSLDHILVSDSLFNSAEFDAVHVNTEFSEVTGVASDHDPLIASLEIPNADNDGTGGDDSDDDGTDTDNDGTGGDDSNDTKDTLLGTAGEDNLRGGSGDEILAGGLGDDLLTGDGGQDSFILNSGEGVDTITDFTVGVDQIVLGNLSADDVRLFETSTDTLVLVNDTNEALGVIAGVQGLDAGIFA